MQERASAPQRVLLAAAVLVAVVGAALAGSITTDASAAGEAGFGDVVVFHMTAETAAGAVAFTSDPGVARPALDAGRPLDPDLEGPTYGPREGVLGFTRATAEGRFQPTPYLLGRRAGEDVVTPLIADAFGPAPVSRLPKTLGPFPGEFTLPLDAARASNATRPDGGPALWVSGERVLHLGVLPVSVGDAVGGEVALIVDVAEGDRIDARGLGVATTVTRRADGSFTLAPVVAVGDVLEVPGCAVADELGIARGRHRVVAEDADGFVLVAAPLHKEALYGETLRFRFTILEVRSQPAWQRAGETALAAVAAWTPWTQGDRP